MLWYLRIQQGSCINLGDSVRQDLQRFQILLKGYHNPPSFKMIDDDVSIHAYIDTSLQGLGSIPGCGICRSDSGPNLDWLFNSTF